MAGAIPALLIGLMMAAGATAAAASHSAMPAPAASPVGIWSTGEVGVIAGGRVRIGRCGSDLCGRVIDGVVLRANPDQRDVRNREAALRGRRILGLEIIAGFRGGPKTWTGGEIYDPETGWRSKTARLKLLSANVLSVKGCIGIFCRTQNWTRSR